MTTSTIERPAQQDATTFAPGEIILFPGPPDRVLRVEEGLVRVHTVDDDGNGLTLRYVKPGGYFGEEALVGLERRYFAEAVTETTVEEAADPRDDGLEAPMLTAHLVEALETMYRSLHRLAGKRLRARIAAELLELRDSAIASVDDEGRAVVHITHDDLAAAVGSVRETVTKVIGELARYGALESGYGKVVLRDVARLREVAGD